MMAEQTDGSQPQTTEIELKYHNTGYEYLDHPADVQIHSWGKTLEEAFEQAAVGMYGIMTELDYIHPIQEESIQADGHDLQSLLYNFLDECLFIFSAEPNLCGCEVKITKLNQQDFTINAVVKGEIFNLEKHPQGTEVKAITYSNMQIHCKHDDFDIYVIVDI